MPAKDRVSPAELVAWPARPPPDQSGRALRFIPGVVFALTLLADTAHNLDFVQRYPETRACCNMGIDTETYNERAAYATLISPDPPRGSDPRHRSATAADEHRQQHPQHERRPPRVHQP